MTLRLVTNHGQRRWLLSWRQHGKYRRRFFRTKDEAENAKRQAESEILRLGSVMAEWTAAQKARIIEAFQKLKIHGGTVEDAVDLWIKHRQARPTLVSPTVDDVLASMLEAKKAAGARPRYLKQLAWSMRSFSERFGAVKADQVRPLAIQNWLASLTGAAVTRRGMLTDVRTLFSYAKRHGWVLHNPADAVERPRVEEINVEIFTPAECVALLASAAGYYPAVLAYLAIAMFAGARPSEVDRLKWSQVKEDFIEIEATKVRTRRRRLVTIAPALRTWLDLAPREGEFIRPINFVRIWRRMIKRAGVKWRHDGLRHSFASYHLAAGRDAAKTAFELGHRSTEMLFGHYRERVTPAEAAEFWALSSISQVRSS